MKKPLRNLVDPQSKGFWAHVDKISSTIGKYETDNILDLGAQWWVAPEELSIELLEFESEKFSGEPEIEELENIYTK